MFKQNILYNDFFDDFDHPDSEVNYSPIYNGTHLPAISSDKSCIVISPALLSSGSYAFLSPNNSGYTDYYGAKIWASFGTMQSGMAYPEIGFRASDTTYVLLSVNDTTKYFCIRQNKTVLRDTSLIYEANKNYIAYLDFNPNEAKLSVAIGEYNTVNNFSNVINRLNELTITAPSTLYLPVFGLTLYESLGIAPKVAYDFFGYSCRRRPIPAL